jgi:4-hydroxy-4-methyl-2-oxoglutarate aldolase
VLETAERIEATEKRIREAVRSGMRLDEARRVHRYHQLQRESTSDAKPTGL